VIGWVALGQALTPLQVLGMAIAFGGTPLGQTRRGHGHAPAPARPVRAGPVRAEPVPAESRAC
jgi:probable blue pigment (indigoidine) exporter